MPEPAFMIRISGLDRLRRDDPLLPRLGLTERPSRGGPDAGAPLTLTLSPRQGTEGEGIKETPVFSMKPFESSFVIRHSYRMRTSRPVSADL